MYCQNRLLEEARNYAMNEGEECEKMIAVIITHSNCSRSQVNVFPSYWRWQGLNLALSLKRHLHIHCCC